MLKKKIFVLVSLFTVICAIQFSMIAQSSTVRATIQPVEISIGQQATINLEIIAPKGRNIVVPIYPDTLVTNIEVLSMPKADTIYANNVMTISQKYIVTSFDSALYYIPNMTVIDGLDTVKSNDFGLKVVSPVLSEETMSYLEYLKENPKDSVDFNKLNVYDIKDVQSPDFVWQDYILYALAILLFIVAVASIIIGIYIYRQKQKKGYFFKTKEILPPHIVALNALNQIRDEKLWQQGREKEYFTDITDILRTYINKRYHVNSFEMTADETLSFVRGILETDTAYDTLAQVLKLADFVKFAKYKPLPNENDLSLANSILFVTQTKMEVALPSNQPEKNLSAEVSNANQNDEEPIDWTIPDDAFVKNDNDVSTNNKKDK